MLTKHYIAGDLNCDGVAALDDLIPGVSGSHRQTCHGHLLPLGDGIGAAEMVWLLGHISE